MFSSKTFPVASILLSFTRLVAAKQLACVADQIPRPEYFGTQVLSLETKEVRGYEEWTFIDHQNTPFERNPIDFCNVSLSYTHPGLGDVVNVYVWLPLEKWNGRFFGQGGGGWTAGHDGALGPAVALGYAAGNTDAGHGYGHNMETLLVAAIQARSWALASPGNVDWTRLQDFASVSLDDMTDLAKQVTESFYRKAPKYSYWNGCSTGGRQGLMLAQRYPKNYDGILAAAPATNWASFLVAEQWGQVLMRKEKYFPPLCEFEAIRKAAIEACDELDGVKDGVVAAPGLCTFDAQSVVGQKFDCDEDSRKISKSAAAIVNGAWAGPHHNGKQEWFGLTHETPLCGTLMLGGLLQTVCDDKSKNCKGSPFPISKDWFELFLARDPNFDVETVTEDDFFRFLHQSRQAYASIMGSDDPDLSDFRVAGGKMITWHGLADELIYPNGSSNYYERVLALDPKARDFYRYFEAPGVAHCAGGIGAYPGQALNSLIDWVEKGKAPEQLDAATIPADKADPVVHRPLCVYPKVAAYKGGPPNDASSFKCEDSFGSKKADYHEHREL